MMLDIKVTSRFINFAAQPVKRMHMHLRILRPFIKGFLIASLPLAGFAQDLPLTLGQSIAHAAARADVAQRVTEAFVLLAAAEHRLEISRSSLAWAERAAHAAQERVRVGKASPIEEQRAEVLRIGAESRVGKAERALALAH